MRKGVGIFLLILVLGGGAVTFWKFYGPKFFESFQRETSDAAADSKTIKVGGDNYLGYFFLTSPEMRKQAARAGLRIDFTDDGGAYADRLEKFKKGEYDCIVLPIPSNIQHGAKHKFPGVIVASVAESRGADGVIGFANALPTGNINRDLNDPNLTFVFTPDSPSSFLLSQTITHFELFNLQGSGWKLEVNSSEEVRKKAEKGEGDVFVLWEPDLSKALEISGMKYVWGSDKFSGLIVDVFVFRREFLEKNRQHVLNFFQTYFRVMGIYANNSGMLVDDVRKATGLKKAAVDTMISKVDWHDLRENAALQFGVRTRPDEEVREGVIDAIIACTDILIRSGVMDSDPTKGDPYILTDKSIVEELVKKSTVVTASAPNRAPAFSPMPDEDWASMREVGTLRTDPITFQFGEDFLDATGKAAADQISVMLKNNYPAYWIAIRGHTAPGDDAANIALSRRRSSAVKQYMTAVHGMDSNRLHAEGKGSSQPPARKPGESERGYRYALLEAGHIAQNFILVAEALGLSTCPYGGSYDKAIEELLHIDGTTESVVYTLLLGKNV